LIEFRKNLEDDLKLKLNNGVQMPIFGLGTFKIAPSEMEKIVGNALEIGYRLFDTAQYYQNEASLGAALRKFGAKRDEIFLITKIKSGGDAAAKIELSLERLQSDYIDLVFLHWPWGDVLKSWRVLENAYKQGKIKALGISNFYGKDYDLIMKNAEIKPAVSQIETNIYRQNKALSEIYYEDEVIMQSWSPFGRGKKGFFGDERLQKIAKSHGATPAQIALRFLIQKRISVIPKASNLEHLRENFGVFDFAINAYEMSKIEEINREKGVDSWYLWLNKLRNFGLFGGKYEN